MNSAILRMWENGVVPRVDAKYKPKRPNCAGDRGPRYQPASLR